MKKRCYYLKNVNKLILFKGGDKMDKRITLFFTVMLLAIFVTSGYCQDEKTQGEFARQLCKALAFDVPTGDYIRQLESQNIIPEGGWQADKAISNSEMASLLARALGLEKDIESKVDKKLQEEYRDRATVISFEGDVKVQIGIKGEWVKADVGMKLAESDSIKTGSDSWAELKVGMVGGIKIKENSVVRLSELSSQPSGREDIILYMSVGEMLVDARGIHSETDFQVRTPTTVAAVRGTVYNVKITGDKTEIIEGE